MSSYCELYFSQVDKRYLYTAKQVCYFTVHHDHDFTTSYSIITYDDMILVLVDEKLFHLHTVNIGHSLEDVLNTINIENYYVNIISNPLLNFNIMGVFQTPICELSPLTMDFYTTPQEYETNPDIQDLKHISVDAAMSVLSIN